MRALRALVLGAVCLAVIAVVAGCSGGGGTSTAPGGGGSTTTSGATITEKGFAFEPTSLEVKAGDTVTFMNQDSAPHNVKIDGKELGTQNQGESVTWNAEKAGSFPYNCTIHPSMTGTIVVK